MKFAVGGGSGGSHETQEVLVVSLQRLGANGQPSGTAMVHEVRGSDGSEQFELELPSCGQVRVTISFRETVSATNPAGIQTKFTLRITEYGCRS